MAQQHGLGRGFDSLIPQNFDASILVAEDERVQKIAIEQLFPRAEQPRQHFDETALEELADSIRTHGVLLPLVVTSKGEGRYQIIAGERRWRAAKIAGLKTLPAIVRTLKELEQLEIALIENVQRVDLSPLEQAVSIERLHQQFSMPYESIAKRIVEGHARAILALKDTPDKQEILLQNIEKRGWSVRDAEQYVVSVKAGFKNEKVAKQRVATETPLTKALSKRFHTPVRIKRMAHGGRLEITFKSDEELERITKLLDT